MTPVEMASENFLKNATVMILDFTLVLMSKLEGNFNKLIGCGFYLIHYSQINWHSHLY